MSNFGLSVTLLVILCSLIQAAASEVYYITANSSDLCTVQPCLTISQFAANSSYYLHSNTTLVFLSGTHYLSNVNLMLSNVDNFGMKSENSTAQIKCANDSHIHISHSQCIHITNLEFIGCGGNQLKHIDNFLVKDAKFEGQQNSGTALELIETKALIVKCIFMSNRNGSYRQCILSDPKDGCFDTSGFIGGAIIATNSTVDISQSKFEDNGADYGGAIFADHSIINILSSGIVFNNTATIYGGILYSRSSFITIQASEFHNNSATGRGGVMYSFNSTIKIVKCKVYNSITKGDSGVLHLEYSFVTIVASGFYNNHAAKGDGGVMGSFGSIVTIESSEFYNNSAFNGYGRGIICSFDSIFTVKASKFHYNTATKSGGVMYSAVSIITICGSNFTENNSSTGAVIYADRGTRVQYCSYLLIDNNSANNNSVIYLSDSEFKGCGSGNLIISNNLGSLMAFNSNITFCGYIKFMNNQPPQTATDDFQEGGAITLFQSNIFFDGNCNLENNHAENGGAIHSTESKLYVNGNVTIAHNTATGNGGGVYLSTSELNCQQKSTFVLFNNTAAHKGGGLHAISSSIKATSVIECIKYCNYDQLIQEDLYIGTRVTFTGNTANWGGGLSLEANAKLYILKYDFAYVSKYYDNDINTAIFTGNSADYGGAVYVDDDTNSGTCASDTKTECFFQVLSLYDHNFVTYYDIIKTQSTFFLQNSADISGSILYGGLLDRCAVSQFAEVYQKYTPNDIERGGGIAYFKNITNAIKKSISSRPVRICVCTNNSIHECTNHSRVDVKKGEAFTVSLVAVDQAGQPVNAAIHTFLNSAESGLAEGQLAKNISAKYTNLSFNVVSPHDSETLALYASDGPCRNAKLSRAIVEIHFLPCSCPIGLQVNSRMYKTNCTCECHRNISQYMKHCDSHTGSLVKQPQSRAWISYINDTDLSGYLVYPNCPFDYCLSTSPHFYLNQPNGADIQCAFNRSSLLCGSCQPDLSLSLGSSRCLSCPSHWPALFIAITIAAILAGIALVALLLILNMTTAVGTLNGLIFYVNVVYANKSILLPFQETNFITVVISWLNLELGIDTCYFPGMDTYIKTWLQLAFPAYVILLVVLIIIISSYSTKFSNIIGKKDPVATLATLILLSYAKLLEVCFKSLSVGILEYPNGSSEMLWLPDATVKYLSGKHIPLFITAVLILLVGLVYTALLFLWQCILCLPKWKIFNWSRNPKIQTFIETYNTPYTPKHRYWTGLLLIARVALYLVAAANVSNNPTTALISISIIVGSYVFLKGFTTHKQYRMWSKDALETFFHLNIFFFAIFSWYSLDNERNYQEAIAYTSVTITIITLLLIVLCHVYTYTNFLIKVKEMRLGSVIDRLFTDPEPNLRVHYLTPPVLDDDSHGTDVDRGILDELDCPVYTGDYDTAPLLNNPVRVQPTCSVLELPKPRGLVPPDPEGANAQNVPADSN